MKHQKASTHIIDYPDNSEDWVFDMFDDMDRITFLYFNRCDHPFHFEYWNDQQFYWKEIYQRLKACLRIRTTPIGLRRYNNVSELDDIPRLRRPTKKHVVCQLINQASRLNYTIGFIVDDIYGINCCTVLGMRDRDEEFLSGRQFLNVWYGELDGSAKHQESMYCASTGCKAVVISPLVSNRIQPEICMLYLNPGQMIHFINGLQYTGYEVVQASVVGESSCSDSWGRALVTGKPCYSIPCFAERRYGGVLDEELLICLTPDQLVKAVEGMEQLRKNGLRYPYAPYGIQNDCQEGMDVSYK